MIDTPLLLTILLHLPASPPPSDQVGVYALVERVELLPSAAAARQVILHGAFCVAEGRNGDYYRAPRFGRMTFVAAEGHEEECRRQWRDLAEAAGDGSVLGFGFRFHQEDPAVAPATGELPEPTAFHPGMGVQRVRHADYGPVRMLRWLPRPIAPVSEGETVHGSADARPAQSVRFEAVAGVAADEKTRYVVTVTREGDVRSSPPLAAEGGRIVWEPWLALRAGERVTWSVTPVDERLSEAPVAVAGFAVAAPRDR